MRSHRHSPARAPAVVTEPGDDRQSELKLFTLWNQGVPPPFSTLDQSAQNESKSLCRATHNPERWWVVTLTALEVVRIAGEPLMPLPRGSLTRAPNAVPSSRLRARIGWGRTGQGHAVDVDIGAGIRLAIEGCEVDVKVVGPRGRMRETTQGDVRPLGDPGVGGMFIDTLVSAHIVPSHGPPSSRRPTLTQVLSVSPGLADRTVVVPPFARRLTVARGGSGALGPLAFRVGATGPSIRELETSPLDPGATVTAVIPQAASHVSTGPADPNPRVLTFIWELDL
ncbi:MAG: hypothetical protein K0V04_15585 [Deltaproteobacteria bacterium]|nr:hypothetical protein [Deltaproteobacteria bacterium]